MQVSVAAAQHPSFFPWAAARGAAVRCLTIWPPLQPGPHFWREGEDHQLEGAAAARFQAAQARFQASLRQILDTMLCLRFVSELQLPNSRSDTGLLPGHL